jgi:hypothetical protein
MRQLAVSRLSRGVNLSAFAGSVCHAAIGRWTYYRAVKRLLIPSLLVLGCGDAELEVVSPADGTTFTTNDPIVFELRGDHIPDADEAEVFVDGSLNDTFTGPTPSGCDPCTLMLTWPRPNVMNGTHEIRFDLTFDLSTVASATVTLTMQRP